MSVSLRDLIAMRFVLQEFATKGKGNKSFEALSGFGSMARQEFDRAGGVDGIGAMISDLAGSNSPRPMSPSKRNTAAPLLTGVALGTGRTVGTARVARDASGPATLKPGDVLVCDIAPGDWHTSVDRLGALVVETAGTSSAAVRAAREMGVPVVRVRDARALIPDGTEVVVDGRAGTVSLAHGLAARA